jgi:hypothetical protein
VYYRFRKNVEEEIVDFIRGQRCIRKVIDEVIDRAEQQ